MWETSRSRVGGQALRLTSLANPHKRWRSHRRQAKFPAFIPAFGRQIEPVRPSAERFSRATECFNANVGRKHARDEAFCACRGLFRRQKEGFARVRAWSNICPLRPLRPLRRGHFLAEGDEGDTFSAVEKCPLRGQLRVCRLDLPSGAPENRSSVSRGGTN
jgi:hypothetical protein